MRPNLAIVVIVALLAACTPEEPPPEPVSPRLSPTPSPASATIRPQPGLSEEAAEVRAQILAAAEHGDYELLRRVLDPEIFLSDFGFGTDAEPDPISRWAHMGPEPLQTMGALLQMDHRVQETNEGRLYRWPSYDENTQTMNEISARDRQLFRAVMTKRELRGLVPSEEYGYVGPRLGILDDGTWWFFILQGGP